METELGFTVNGPCVRGEFEIEVETPYSALVHDYVYLTKRDLERMLELYEEDGDA